MTIFNNLPDTNALNIDHLLMTYCDGSAVVDAQESALSPLIAAVESSQSPIILHVHTIAVSHQNSGASHELADVDEISAVLPPEACVVAFFVSAILCGPEPDPNIISYVHFS